MSVDSTRKEGWLAIIKTSFKEWSNDNATRLSAAVAYYSAFSIAPLLVIAMGVAGLVFNEEAVRGQLHRELSSYIGPVASKGVESMVQSASKPSHGWTAMIVGFVVLLFGASGVFTELKSALNTIWGVKQKPTSGFKTLFTQKLLSFGMVLVIGLLLLISLVLTTATSGLASYLESLLHIPGVVLGGLNFVLSLALETALFAAIFKVLPDVKIRWRDVWIGALVTAGLFELGKFGLGLYLGRESTASSYGAAASVALLLLWVYYSSCILFFGAEFTQVYAAARGRELVAAENAEIVVDEPAEHAPVYTGPEPSKEHLPAPVIVFEPETRLAKANVALTRHPMTSILTATGLSFVATFVAKRFFKQR